MLATQGYGTGGHIATYGYGGMGRIAEAICHFVARARTFAFAALERCYG